MKFRSWPAICMLLLAVCAFGQAPPNAINPEIAKIVEEVSGARIGANLRKLESFGTRYVLSAADHPTRGIGAARRWIREEFASYSPRLEVSEQIVHVKKGPRLSRDVDVANVIAVLPGEVHPDRYVLITAHYDSVNQKRKPVQSDKERIADLVEKGMVEAEAARYVQLFPGEESLGELDPEATEAQTEAPGVTDNGSGTAAVMELARVMSRHEFDKSLVFIAFASEEISLDGSKAYAAEAESKRMRIEGVFNNDIIGSIAAGNGRVDDRTVRMFAEGPDDSPGRALLRYAKLMGERYAPSMHVEMIFRRDRFGRGGDHTSFQARGFPAVRITTPSENYENQHTATDTFANTSVPYAARVAKINAAAAANLALAPSAPITNFEFHSGERKGDRTPMLNRGKSGYDASLRWMPDDDQVAGYAVVFRQTTSPDWEREIWVGNVTRFTIADFSIDDTVIGVKAVDQDGNQSPVAAYLEPVNRRLQSAAQPEEKDQRQ